MRKMLPVLLLACAGMVFAQEAPPAEDNAGAATKPSGEKKNALSLDLFTMFKGFIATNTNSNSETGYFCVDFNYERFVAPHFSIGAGLDLYPGKIHDVNFLYFSLTALGRFYPMSESFKKFFIGTGLGFNTVAIDGSNSADDGGFLGLTVSLKAGYKLVTSKNIYIEPSMSYVLSKTAIGGVYPLGWQGGLRFGFVF